jgi:hypothetical protein
LDWKKCKWACTDGAPSMAGKIKGLAAKMKAVSPNMLIVPYNEKH